MALSDLTLYDPFEGMRFGPEQCFLCGTPTTPPTDTVPVFAPWLMKRYQLADRPIRLLDQSITTYQNLTISCCARCRTQYVEPLETQVAEAAAAGLDGLRALPEKTLFLWLGKMFYGVLVTELLTELNPLIKPRYPLAENAQMFRRFQAYFQTLQALRVPIEFDDFAPASVFIVETDAAQPALPFEYDDDLTTMVFSIKLDNAVITSCLVDNGIIRQAMRGIYQQAQRPLHPAQIAEFKARVYYAAYLFNVVPDYYTRPVQAGDDHVVMDTLIDDVTGPVFNPWDNSGYGQALLEMWKPWHIPLAEIMQDPAQPRSFLYDEAGNPQSVEAVAELLAQRPEDKSRLN
ncbi:hypothetical protein MUN82_18235 [Hymenobacter aerilatus]|uniref:Uncharacterized protein n=1 Tax=Hymenobacter aerilatus TaxID=2932251 RepID=A0A8T9SYL5_9BACT|nr:hypothetical protein [Hymenobacter aerilatus]UOR04869.1 hypothetical protein MUN82_18235 [Hymenobacter aerilatus]